jgi:DNA-binding transcriptional regulator GbsR (MarR family)
MKGSLQYIQKLLNHQNNVESSVEMASRDPSANDAVRRFVERFALLLTEAGMPRMPARVFACILAEDDGQLTAGELADRLEVSPAAISGAVRYLTQVGLIFRTREPGERRDHYRLHDDVWAELYTARAAILSRWEQAMAEGVELLGTDRPAGRRIEETREFFAFLREELPAVMQRWRERRSAARS